MSKKVAIVQSNYIPWKGYFDLIHSVDEFVLFDDVQYTKRDWRNRNIIKTGNGELWLSIPVSVKGKYLQPIKEVKVLDQDWKKTHWMSIKQAYARADKFKSVEPFLKSLYDSCESELLSEINYHFIRGICDFLGIKTKISFSMQYEVVEGKNERLIEICKATGATHYLSGPAASSYMDVSLFNAQGIQVEYMDYSGYPEYPQVHPPFTHQVSVVDLIANMGEDSTRFLKTFQTASS